MEIVSNNMHGLVTGRLGKLISTSSQWKFVLFGEVKKTGAMNFSDSERGYSEEHLHLEAGEQTRAVGE